MRVQTKPRPCGELGPITRVGITYHFHTVLLQEAHSMPQNVTAQMAPVNDIHLLMLVKQTAKHHGLGIPTEHATRRAVTPTYCTGYLLLHRKQPHYIFVNSNHKQFGQLPPRKWVWQPGSPGANPFSGMEYSTNCLFQKSESYGCPIIKVERLEKNEIQK